MILYVWMYELMWSCCHSNKTKPKQSVVLKWLLELFSGPKQSVCQSNPSGSCFLSVLVLMHQLIFTFTHSFCNDPVWQRHTWRLMTSVHWLNNLHWDLNHCTCQACRLQKPWGAKWRHSSGDLSCFSSPVFVTPQLAGKSLVRESLSLLRETESEK